jgi:outer membrane protein
MRTHVRIYSTVCFAVLALLLCSARALRAQAASAGTPPSRLTLRDAEQLALKNNPQISLAKLLTLAQEQVTREARSSEMPTAAVNLTAVEPHNGSRIAAGALNNPTLYERAAGGLTVGQLITDFGRTRNLVGSARFRELSQVAAEKATAADVTLAVDQAFYSALSAQAQLNIAQQTVTTRQTTADQVQALTRAKLKSDLDLSFANVNLAQAKVLLLDAQNRKDAAFADLNAVLGFEKQQAYLLIDETGGAIPVPAADESDLLNLAFRSRPDLAALDDQREAAERFRRAEHDLNRPSISALGVVGDAAVRVNQIDPWWGAVGVNVNIPLFNGFLFSARAREADYRAAATQQQVRDLRDRIARDVQVTWLEAQSSYQRVSVSEQLLSQANLALDLAQTRYQLGLSSIVELSQAQLQQTEAAIGSATARYNYLTALSALRFQTGQ